MQYILSQAEYDALQPKAIGHEAAFAVKFLREKLVGENCIHSDKNIKVFRYCDTRPLSSIGARTKEEVSKRPSYYLSKLVCDLPREYSK